MNESEIEIMRENTEIEFTETLSFQSPKKVLESDRGPNAFPRQIGVGLSFSQIRAIFLKNLSFQSRQTATNIFQILVPLICLALIWISKYEVSLNLENDIILGNIGSIPFFMNLPSILDRESSINPISVSDCHKWFLVNEMGNKNSATINYLTRPQFPHFCQRSNVSVPFSKSTNLPINHFLYTKLSQIDENPLYFGEEIKDLDLLPDAAFTFNQISEQRIDVDLHVNDLLFSEYHRNNGFSKFSFRLPKNNANLYQDVQATIQTVRNDTRNASFTSVFSQFLVQNNSKTSEKLFSRARENYNKTKNAIREYFSNKNLSLPVV